MNRKLTLLIERRNYLVAQAAAQRLALVQDLETWRAPLALVDRGMAVMAYVKQHPALPVAVTLLITALRPQRAGKYLMRGWLLWQLGRKLFKPGIS